VQVDGVFQAEPIGHARAKVVGIGIAKHLAIALGHQPGQTAAQHLAAAAAHFRDIGDLGLESAGAMQHRVGINRLNGGQISVGAGSQAQRRLAHRVFFCGQIALGLASRVYNAGFWPWSNLSAEVWIRKWSGQRRQVRRIYRANHGSWFQQQSGQRIVQCNPSDLHINSTACAQRLMQPDATPIYSP